MEIYTAAGIENIRRKEKSDGSGDLIFTNNVPIDSRGRRTAGLYGIQQVRSVEQHLFALQRTQQSG